MMYIDDLKIGDLIFFKAGKYKSCDVIVGFELDCDNTYIRAIIGNRNLKYSTDIFGIYSSDILHTIRQLDNGIFAYHG